ncbi:glutamate receptor ionotropic, delta-2-like [Panulirus ornatus]|uniref:glutamate receptor ionotropic, delta-2-like n=1 Tax=Panulirus ornatus TaxID=150431 RepID=UPI003A877400
MMANSTVYLIVLSFTVPLMVAQLPRYDAEQETLNLAKNAVESVLTLSSCAHSSVILVSDGDTSATTVFQAMDRLWAPWGVAVFQVAADGQEANVTQAMISEVISQVGLFRYSFVRPPDGSWGTREADGSYTGMVGMVGRREVDVGLGPFGISEIRSLAADFTRPILIDYIRIMGGRGRPEVDPWGFLLPLTPLVWAAILTMLLVVPTGVVLGLSTSVFRNTRRKTTDVFFAYIRVLLQEDYIVPTEWGWWERLLLGVWMMMTVVLTRSYEGNLMSLLAVRHIPQPYQSLRQVIDDPAVTMVWEPNTVYVEFYRKDFVTSTQLASLFEYTKHNP